jgi:PRTRC genetic system protein C
MEVHTITREFVWKGTKLPDPNPTGDLNAVRDALSHTHPEIANAAIDRPTTKGGVHTYTFVASVGTKG